MVGRSAQPPGVAAAVFGQQTRSLVGEGREGVDVHHAAHRVAPVERRLGAAQDFDALDVGQLGVVAVLVEDRHVVDVHAHDGLVDAGAETAHVDRRGHARAVVGDVEVGNALRKLLDGVDVLLCDGPAAEDGGGHGLRAQRGALLDGGDLHVVDHDCGVDGGVFFRRAVFFVGFVCCVSGCKTPFCLAFFRNDVCCRGFAGSGASCDVTVCSKTQFCNDTPPLGDVCACNDASPGRPCGEGCCEEQTEHGKQAGHLIRGGRVRC